MADHWYASGLLYTTPRRHCMESAAFTIGACTLSFECQYVETYPLLYGSPQTRRRASSATRSRRCSASAARNLRAENLVDEL